MKQHESPRYKDWRKRCIASGQVYAPKLEFPLYNFPLHHLHDAIFNRYAQKKFMSVRKRIKMQIKNIFDEQKRHEEYLRKKKKELYTPPPGYVPVWNPVIEKNRREKKEDNQK